ncbi:MAG: hypothetical protein LVQ95_04020 [Candidatus Micrarchaeales archaeon]|nr:hypothetical protein [Candidatus Micrarchaeales archaeon]
MKAQAFPGFVRIGWPIILAAIIVLVLFIVLVPFILVAAFNTIFGLSIQFSFLTWLAALLLIITIGSHGGAAHSFRAGISGRLLGFVAAFVLISIIVFPLMLLWSLNTLFPVSIHYTFFTWLAALAIELILGSFSWGSAVRVRYMPGPPAAVGNQKHRTFKT